jgi:hypothetical protein
MKKYQWASLSLLLNALGFVLLFVAFQASSSDLKIVRKDDTFALCFSGTALFQASGNGRYFGMAKEYSSCSDGKPTAIVNSDFPWLGKIGFLFILVSFWAQLKSIDRTEATLTSSQLRALRNLGLFRE